MSGPFGVEHVSKALTAPVGKLGKLKPVKSTSAFRSGAYGGKKPVFGKKRKAAFKLGQQESRNV